LWLTASDYNQAADTWTDASSHGTVFGGQGAGEVLTDPLMHTPQSVSVTNNGKTFPAVNFRQAFDPVAKDPGFVDGHWSDRMYQRSNNTPGSNPLMLGGDLTMFVVCNSLATGSGLGSGQCITGIRGPSGAPYNLFLNSAGGVGHFGLITYAGSVAYQSNLTIPATGTISGWGIVELKYSNTSAGSSTVQIGQDFGIGMQWSDPMTVPRNASAGTDAVYPTKDAPFAIGAHVQANGATTDNPYGGGTYERWAGYVGDILVYNTALSGTAETDIQNYLRDKYGFPNIAVGTDGLGLAPYVWKCSGTGSSFRAEATMPGAYLKSVFQGTTTVGLTIDGTANTGCPASSMPVIEYSIDNNPFTIVQLTTTGSVYTLPLASGLSSGAQHTLELYFRAADMSQNRWTASTAHLRIAGAGLALDSGGVLVLRSKRPALAIGFGDSITEGVGVDGLFTSWQILTPNNARGTWFPMVCSALNCEYGQLGTGGQGMVNPALAVPPLPQTWDKYDSTSSRLTGGLLLPEPNYVFCEMGTNDSSIASQPFKDAYTAWLITARQACPNARIFCVTSPFGDGWHSADVWAVVAARNQAGDAKVYLMDVASLVPGFKPTSGGPSLLTYDGGHPSLYGH
ncbi:MAG: GDSL-type esterase/lipase family protein, partial [Sideroxyarcus sp.]|nr:GDSL-type esterase/lipase family protein [Sideroxyarcus sp.]